MRKNKLLIDPKYGLKNGSKHCLKIFLLSASALVISTPVLASPAMDWIQTMSSAMRNLTYRGNFVYLHANQLESMQISHLKDKGGEKERLLSLNGEAREVLRDNQNLTCVWPSSRKVVIDYSRQTKFSPIFIPEDIVKLAKLYEFKLLADDRIADFETVVVQIKPKDNLRYGMKFWINRENGLMMKSSLIGQMHQEVEQVMFTNLEVFDDPSQLELQTLPKIDDSFSLIRYHSGDASQTLVTDTAWRLDLIPRGFWQESVMRREIQGSNKIVQQMVYTDGLASLSIFIEQQSGESLNGGTSMGAVNVFMRVINNHSITVIGAVPALTVKQVAQAVSYRVQ